MTTGRLITISGVDGSGKSSHSLALLQSLTSQGLPAARAWVGHKPVFSFPFLALVRALGYTHRKKIEGIPFYWRDLKRNSAISKLWPLVLSIDFVPKAILGVTVPLLMGKTVICDRYVYDIIAELSQQGFLGSRTKRILLRMLPRPNVAFLMDVDDNLAWKRSLSPGRAREQPIYGLAVRRREFLRLAKELGLIVIDGSQDPELNRSLILNNTRKVLELDGNYVGKNPCK